ncbi:MAG: hypothetical protein Tsb0021_03230 [Chlamydiales bacterium]
MKNFILVFNIVMYLFNLGSMMLSSGIHTIHSSLCSALRCITHLQRKIDAIFRRIFSRNSQQPQQNQRFNPTTISVLTNSTNISSIPGTPSVFETSQAFQNHFQSTNTESQKISLSSLFDSIPKTQQGIENLKDRIDKISYSTNMETLSVKPPEEPIPEISDPNYDWNKLRRLMTKYWGKILNQEVKTDSKRRIRFYGKEFENVISNLEGRSNFISEYLKEEIKCYLQFIVQYIVENESNLEKAKIERYLFHILDACTVCSPTVLRHSCEIYREICLNNTEATTLIFNILEDYKINIIKFWGMYPRGPFHEPHFISTIRLEKGEEWGLLTMDAKSDKYACSPRSIDFSYFECKLIEAYGNTDSLINGIEANINDKKLSKYIFPKIVEILKNHGLENVESAVSDCFFDEDGNILSAGVKLLLLDLGILIPQPEFDCNVLDI